MTPEGISLPTGTPPTLDSSDLARRGVIGCLTPPFAMNKIRVVSNRLNAGTHRLPIRSLWSTFSAATKQFNLSAQNEPLFEIFGLDL